MLCVFLSFFNLRGKKYPFPLFFGLLLVLDGKCITVLLHVPLPHPSVSRFSRFIVCECVWFSSAKTTAASIDGREKMKDRQREERKGKWQGWEGC